MNPSRHSCPMSHKQVVDQYFMEHRAKVLDIAAFLDRIDRASSGDAATHDFRVTALRHALRLLTDGKGERAKRVLELMSDPTGEPIASAAGMKGALGAYQSAG